jgi:alcohol dehydrogenase
MQPFDFQLRPRIVFGAGTIARLGELAKGYGARRVLIVSDPGVVQAGHFGAGVKSLEQAGITVQSFHEFGENPTTRMVELGIEVARRVQPDLLVGLGGGSSMDCCKGINFVYSCGGSMRDYHGIGKATSDLLPMIAVPTTAGTGSEAQSFALISDAETHVKMACGDPRAACRVAILDPELTVTMPSRVTSLTGIDALSHAIETYVTRRRNAMSIMFSRQAFRLLATGFSRVLAEPTDIEARGQMQLGACFAGMAIETSMLGAAHATANPLTAKFDITHGQAVGVMLPSVIRLNGHAHADWYAELLREIEPVPQVSAAPQRLAELVSGWLREASLATSLDELGVPNGSDFELATDAGTQWTGTFNPVPLTHQLLAKLYQASRQSESQRESG